jgi:nucleoside-diphosphate-sugar epimerase
VARILILGGTRFFGLQLVQHLCELGHEVTVLTRGIAPVELPPSVEQLRGNRQDRRSLIEAVGARTWDVVIDNIGYTANDGRVAIDVFDGRAGRFLFMSTSAVYYCLENIVNPYKEEATELLPIKEKARRDERYAYGFGKLEAERALLAAFRERRFPVTILRVPIVIGPRDYTLRAYSYWIRILDGAPLILPDGGRHDWRFIFSGDVVRAFVRLLDADGVVGQGYNFAQQEIVSLREWVKLSAEILNRSVEMVGIPNDWLAEHKIAADFSPYTTSHSWILDLSKAERGLGWQSTPWREWMTTTIQWFEREYNGPPPENYLRRAEELKLIDRWRVMTKFG